ncbi:hypothetical protein ACLOAU_11840 [Niabella sp. CJ426]|uniref:hypothetical protein n=1 Tax=Niabella sp. CJ426 TaxID=3393740 RepID=UPI003D063B6E
MKTFIFLLAGMIGTYISHSQNYIVKCNNDTVYCEIKKIDLDRIKVKCGQDSREIWDAKEIKLFVYDGVTWTTNSFRDGNKWSSTFSKTVYVFLPQDKRNGYYKMGVWGNPLTGYSRSFISVTTDGRTTFYSTTENKTGSAGFAYGAGGYTALGVGTGASNIYSMFLKNDDLGITGIPFGAKRSEETAETKRLLLLYTSDRPEVSKELDSRSFKAKPNKIEEYMSKYFGRLLSNN